MASLSDHTRRDAGHAARSYTRIYVGQYIRRMDELARAYISEAIEEANNKGEAIDGIELGKAAADRARAAFIGTGEPRAAIDAGGSETPED